MAERIGMQISRHWRLNSQRYRLEGVRYPNGEVKLQSKSFLGLPDKSVVHKVVIGQNHKSDNKS